MRSTASGPISDAAWFCPSNESFDGPWLLKEEDMSDGKPITLVLTTWQQRMVCDHVPTLRTAPPRQLTLSAVDRLKFVTYRMPPFASLKTGAWNLYLTDAQIKKVSAALGVDVKIAALTIAPAHVTSGAIAFR